MMSRIVAGLSLRVAMDIGDSGAECASRARPCALARADDPRFRLTTARDTCSSRLE